MFDAASWSYTVGSDSCRVWSNQFNIIIVALVFGTITAMSVLDSMDIQFKVRSRHVWLLLDNIEW